MLEGGIKMGLHIQTLRLATKELLKSVTKQNTDLLGYEYASTALAYMLINRIDTVSMPKTELCGKVASYHKTTLSRVERNMRHYIAVIQVDIQKYFNTEKEIKLAEFLALITDELETYFIEFSNNVKGGEKNG